MLRNALLHILGTGAHKHTYTCVQAKPRFTKHGEGVSEAAGLRGIWIHHRERDASHAFCSHHFDPDLTPAAN